MPRGLAFADALRPRAANSSATAGDPLPLSYTKTLNCAFADTLRPRAADGSAATGDHAAGRCDLEGPSRAVEAPWGRRGAGACVPGELPASGVLPGCAGHVAAVPGPLCGHRDVPQGEGGNML